MEKMLNQLSENDLHWLGGFWDGEGSWVVSRQNTKPRPNCTEFFTPRASVSSCDREVIDEVYRLIGVGGICSHKRGNPKHKTRHVFEVGGRKACELASALQPYLRIDRKREAARIVSEFPSKKRINKGKGSHGGGVRDYEGHELQRRAYEMVTELNKRGLGDPPD